MSWRVQVTMGCGLAWLLLACDRELPGEGVEGEEITCSWFAEDNCWKKSLSQAAQCIQGTQDEEGVLTEDGTVCTFDNGMVIDFDNPVDLQAMETQLWKFSITRDGAFCMSFSEPTGEKRILITSLGTYREQIVNGALQIICPSGDTYKVSNPTLLFSCQDYRDILPGLRTEWSDDAFQFSFAGGTDGKLSFFACRR